MKKMVLVLLCVGSTVLAKWHPEPTFENDKLILREGKTKCGAITLQNRSDQPITLVGTAPFYRVPQGKVQLKNRGSSVRFKYDGLGRKDYFWILCLSNGRIVSCENVIQLKDLKSNRQCKQIHDSYKPFYFVRPARAILRKKTIQ